MKDPFTRHRHRSRENKEDAVGTAPGLLLAQLPEKRQLSLQPACTAFEAFLHAPHFFKGTMTGSNAPQSPGAELLRLRNAPVRIELPLLGMPPPPHSPASPEEELNCEGLILLHHRSWSLLRYRNS